MHGEFQSWMPNASWDGRLLKKLIVVDLAMSVKYFV
jgi:hypothetical protein